MKAAGNKYFLLLTSVCFLLFNAARAQQFPEMYFENITKTDGLSDNEVSCFYQDKEGFLWIGTRNGLNRFDGSHFTIFQNNPNDPHSISGNSVIDILQDSDGMIWIATK